MKFKIGDLVKRKNGKVVYEIISINERGVLYVQAIKYKNFTSITPFSAERVENE